MTTGPAGRSEALALIAIGWLASGLLGTLPVVRVAGFALDVAHLAAPALLWAGGSVLWGGGWRPVLFCAGWYADVAVWLEVRPGMQAPGAVAGPGSLAVLGSVGLLLSTLLVAALAWRRERPEGPVARLSGLAAVVVGTVLACRLVHALLCHIPNDARSIFLAGVEIHHLSLGLLAVALVGVWAAGARRRARRGERTRGCWRVAPGCGQTRSCS